jgi:lantibiotic modifying enzyme
MKVLKDKIFEIEKSLSGYDGSDLSLYNGSMGIAIFYAKLFEMTKEKKYAKKTEQLINHIISQLSNVQMSHTLASGFTGVAWGLHYLAQKGFLKENPDDLFVELDKYIQEAGMRDLRNGMYDFIHGGMGSIVFCLNRLPNKNVLAFLDQAIIEIDKVKREDEFGLKWIDLFSNRHLGSVAYNFGLAHGMPSIVAVLLKVYAKGLFQDKTSKLIQGALAWILHHKNLDEGFISIYPTLIFEKETEADKLHSRLAWCYGDLSMGLIFWNAGELLKMPAWKNEGLQCMNHSLKRIDPLENIYLDGAFCHGTAGIAHLFNRCYLVTGNLEFLDRASFWINETLKQAKFEDGLAGYKARDIETWINRFGLLEGIAGIGLVLISYLSKNNSDWDECLLL